MRFACPDLPARNAAFGPTSDQPSSVTHRLASGFPFLAMMPRIFLSLEMRLVAVGAYGLTPRVSNVPLPPAEYICWMYLKTLGFDRRLSGSPAVTISAFGSTALIAGL